MLTKEQLEDMEQCGRNFTRLVREYQSDREADRKRAMAAEAKAKAVIKMEKTEQLTDEAKAVLGAAMKWRNAISMSGHPLEEKKAAIQLAAAVDAFRDDEHPCDLSGCDGYCDHP